MIAWAIASPIQSVPSSVIAIPSVSGTLRPLGHREREQEQQREERDRREQHLVLAAEVRRGRQPDRGR